MKTVSYTLSDKEEAAALAFIAQEKQKLIEKQRLSMTPEDFEHFTNNGQYPYTGAIGGAVSYEIYHTSIGTGIIVHYLDAKQDVTDFSDW